MTNSGLISFVSGGIVLEIGGEMVLVLVTLQVSRLWITKGPLDHHVKIPYLQMMPTEGQAELRHRDNSRVC
jgi:hypothetical protein